MTWGSIRQGKLSCVYYNVNALHPFTYHCKPLLIQFATGVILQHLIKKKNHQESTPQDSPTFACLCTLTCIVCTTLYSLVKQSLSYPFFCHASRGYLKTVMCQGIYKVLTEYCTLGIRDEKILILQLKWDVSHSAEVNENISLGYSQDQGYS